MQDFSGKVTSKPEEKIAMFVTKNKIGTRAFALISYLLGSSLTVASEPAVLFHDEFDGPLSAKWDTWFGSAYTSSGGAYLVGGGPKRGALVLTRDDLPSNDFKITTRFMTTDPGYDNWYGGAVYFNVHNPHIDELPDTYYALQLLTPNWSLGQSYESNSLVIGKTVNHTGDVLRGCGWYPTGAPPGLMNDDDNKVDISVNGGHFEVWVNDKFAFACDDPDPIVGGKAGMVAIFESTNRYEYFHVEGLSSQSTFTTFSPRAELRVGPKANDDSYWVRGYLKLADTSNGINLLTEPVTVKFGSFSYTIPAGAFVQDGSSYFFKGPVGPSTLDVKIFPLGNQGAYWFKSCLTKGDLEATTVKPQVLLSIGDDQGQATFDVGYAKFGKGKRGAQWVFPEVKVSQ